MQSSSRRAFFTGRRSSQSPWDAFCQRMRSCVSGEFYDYGAHDDVGSARLSPGTTADVRHARALCSQYEVVMALDGQNNASSMSEQSVLWVDPGQELTQCKRLPEDRSKWFIQPGCRIGQLQQAGLRQFDELPAYLTVAAWLADRSLCDWGPGLTHRSGLAHASVLLADGAACTLGPFGADNNQPLGNLTLQTLVPALFQLAAQPESATCRQQAHWPCRYRLDALVPEEGVSPNLSHLVLGHGGDLGWVEWVVLQELPDEQVHSPHSSRFSTRHRDPEDDVWYLALDLDVRVKALFDPHGVFPHPGQDL